jgi:hypothetical protein
MAEGNKDRLGSAMNCAAGLGFVDIVRRLLELGVSAKAKQDRASTPLLRAVEGGHYETAELLLDNGADANFKRCAHARKRTPACATFLLHHLRWDRFAGERSLPRTSLPRQLAKRCRAEQGGGARPRGSRKAAAQERGCIWRHGRQSIDGGNDGGATPHRTSIPGFEQFVAQAVSEHIGHV